MFKSKGFVILIIILAICLVLFSYHMISNNNVESDSNAQNYSNDTMVMYRSKPAAPYRTLPIGPFSPSRSSCSGPACRAHAEEEGIPWQTRRARVPASSASQQ